MRPLVVLDGKPRLWNEFIRYCEVIRSTPTRLIPGNTWGVLTLRNREQYLIGKVVRSVRPSGRRMYSVQRARFAE